MVCFLKKHHSVHKTNTLQKRKSDDKSSHDAVKKTRIAFNASNSSETDTASSSNQNVVDPEGTVLLLSNSPISMQSTRNHQNQRIGFNILNRNVILSNSNVSWCIYFG
jgi:hypothetical protein